MDRMDRKVKTFLVFFILTAVITVAFANVPTAEAIVSDTQSLNSAWITDTSNGFAQPSASDALDSSTEAIWIDNGETSAQWIEFSAAPGEGLFSFDLTSLTLGKYQPDWNMTFTIVGTKTDNSTTAPVTLSWPNDGNTEKTFSGVDLSGLTGLTKFKVSFGGTDPPFPIWYAEFRQFTIANQVNSGNVAPIVTGLDDVFFQENDVNAAPRQIDPDITATDSDSMDFDGGQVTVSYTAAGLAEDQLAVGNIGNISLSGSAVNYAGVGQIGTASGGSNGSPLVIALNANATPARVTELLRSLTYQNTSNEPASYRTISLTVSDGDGGTSGAVTARIGVSGQAEAGVENPALTQDLSYPDWVNNLNNGFAIAASAGVALAGNGTSIWISGGDSGPASLTISAAEQFAGGMFDLTGIAFDLVSGTYTITVTGHKAGGGTVTTSATGSSEAEFNAINLSAMTQLTSLDIQIQSSSGGDVSNLGVDSFTIANPHEYVGNYAPSITGLDDITFQENTVNAAPRQIDSDITVTDSDSANFDGGQVTIAYTAGGSTEDQLVVSNIGSISVFGSAVSYSGTQIGTVSGGSNGTSLVIDLNANATPARITELLRALAYQNTSNEPTSYRTLSITVSDGDGGTSTAATVKIGVSGQAESGVENPALTQNLSFPGWVEDLNNGFAVTPNGSVTLGGNASFIWINGGGNGPASLSINADEQFTGGAFDLTGMVFDLVSGTYSVTVTGHKAGGGTVTANVTNGSSEAEFNAINLNAMTGLTSFEVQISGSGNISNLALNSFTIANPQAANLPPVFTSNDSFNVAETAQADNTVLHNVQAHDGDGGGNDANLTYSIADGTGQSYFSINSTTGEIKLTATGETSLDYESATGYILTVRADDGQAANNTTDQNITVNVTDVAPAITAGQSFTVSEGAANGTPVGAVANTGDHSSIAFSIQAGNEDGIFAIDGTGEISVADSTDLDAETTALYTLTIRASDGTTNSDAEVTVRVCAADGSGAMIVTPDMAITSQTGLTLVFTYTAAAGGIENGAVSINVPDGWSPPSINSTGSGYTTASAGMVSVSGRTITVTGITLAGSNSITITYGDKSGGGTGSTAMSAADTSIWQARSKATAAGNLTDLDISPQVTVGSRVTVDPAADSTIEGGSAQYEVVLVSPPTADVVISITPDSWLNVDKASLTFTGTNYSTPQTVTVTAIDNHIPDGDRTGAITHTVSSADTLYNDISVADFNLDITDNDTPDIILTPGGTIQVTEGGASGAYTLVLATQPTDSVTVHVYGGSEIDIHPQTLEFTTGNWNVSQEVSITAVDDDAAEGPHSATVTHSVYSNDPDYDGFNIPDVDVDITDNDSPGISIDQSGGPAVVTEGGGDYTYTMVLTTRPYDDVEISISGGSQLEVDPEEWTFTTGNWDTPKTIRVWALDDAIAEGIHIGTVSHSVYSPDPGYNDYDISPITVQINDNDASANANLSGLVLSSGTLDPAFDPATINYSLSVAYSVNSITVTPFLGDSNATVTVNGEPLAGGQVSSPINLHVGTNSISVLVTAQDGITTKLYTITVDRAASGGNGKNRRSTQPQAGTSVSIKANTGGKVSFDKATVEIPAGVLPADATLSIKALSQNEADKVVPEGLRIKMAGTVYEITITGERRFGDNYITIKLAYDPAGIAQGEFPAIHYCDETLGHWIRLETQLVQEDDRWYAVTRVNHLTMFAIFSTAAEPEIPEDKTVVTLTIGRNLAHIDGNPYTLDAPPHVDGQSRRTMAPIRFISEALGAKVKWDSLLRQVSIEDGDKVIVLTLGSSKVLVDGAALTMDCAPEVLPPGRIFIPLRFVSEALGAQVDYDSTIKQITLTRQNSRD